MADFSPSATPGNEAPPEVLMGWFSQAIIFCLLVVIVLFSSLVLSEQQPAAFASPALFSLSVIGLWRWGWGCLHLVRAMFFRMVYFPSIRRRLDRIVAQRGPVPELSVLATTFHEHLWITRIVIRSLIREFSLVQNLSAAPRLVFVTGGDDDDANVLAEFGGASDELMAAAANGELTLPTFWPPTLTLLRGADGKRSAIAKGLKHLRQEGVHPEGVIVLMDGDTAPELGALKKVLPLFRESSRTGAVTTNERPVIQAPAWFTEWIKLRFGQRHLYMCSVGLSRRLLCLTGRLSAFRADLATDVTFIDQIENDSQRHWLFGEYRMFSGDDKSTWFWMSKNGYDLMYVPDAMVVTYEVISPKDSSITRGVANMKRWSGNMLRNAGRAAALGPRRLGIFTWLCTLDQQVSMWTVMIGPVAMLLACFAGRYDFVAAYAIWLIATRTIRATIGWVHGRRFSPVYVPLQLASEWCGAVVKMWVYFHPVKQTWLNRGNRTLDSSKSIRFPKVRAGLANYYFGYAIAGFVLAVGMYIGLVPILDELPLLQATENMTNQSMLGVTSVPASVTPQQADVVFWGAKMTTSDTFDSDP